MRWYLRGDEDIRNNLAIIVAGLSMLWIAALSLLFVVGVIAETWRGLGRASVVVTALALAWCTAFLRRGRFPPKDAEIIGGDDE